MQGGTAPGRTIEWPTWAALAGCYGVWALALAGYASFGWVVLIPAALAATFHSSLQHEVLHGHPTRNAALNEALVFLPLGLVYPYRRFKDTHLRHHCDERLTDPYDDPESWYVAEGDYNRLGALMRAILAANGTLVGRVLLGPALAVWGFWRDDLRSIRAGNVAVIDAWMRHGIGLVGVLALLAWAGLPLWLYAALVAYPALSLLAIRTFIEHRAAMDPKMRSAVVEDGGFFALLFLNNNLHRVHHERPALPWYRLPALWRAERARFLAENGNYLLPGYGAVLRLWGLRRREPVVHPTRYRLNAAPTPPPAPGAAQDRAA